MSRSAARGLRPMSSMTAVGSAANELDPLMGCHADIALS